MRIVTYNIHKARGIDGRVSITRIAEVLAGLNADIIALQEVFAGSDARQGQVEAVAQKLKMHAAFGRVRHHRSRPYGNAILSRWPIVQSRDIDLSQGRRGRRGGLRADLKTPHGMLHVYNIHMGTRYFARRHQARNLLSSPQLHDELAGPRVLVGDFNEWTQGLATRMLSAKFESLNLKLHVGRRRSYPGFAPVLHLDHMYFESPLRVEKAELIRTRMARVASDHLPLVATFGWSTK